MSTLLGGGCPNRLAGDQFYVALCWSALAAVVGFANLPVDAEIASTKEMVVPADRAGVMVNFGVRSDTTSALVTFTRPGGEVIPAGAVGRIEGGDEFVVGYDGQAFVRNLSASNTATIEFVDGTCRANFSFAPRPGEQVQISPVECR